MGVFFMFEIEQYKDFIYKKIENLDKEDKKICKALMIREELGEYFLEMDLKVDYIKSLAIYLK